MRSASLSAFFVVAFVVVSTTWAGQNTDRPLVYTTAQAEAGRLEVRTNAFGVCSDCHAESLTGRIGAPGELPLVSSLSEDKQQTIKVYGKVPALVGPEFRKRWADRTTKDLTKEFLERFGNLSEETRLNLIAYILQANGAPAGRQPLTMETGVPIRSLAPKEAN